MIEQFGARPKITSLILARIAGNIMSGFASRSSVWAMPSSSRDRAHNDRVADEALRLARYIVAKAEEPGPEAAKERVLELEQENTTLREVAADLTGKAADTEIELARVLGLLEVEHGFSHGSNDPTTWDREGCAVCAALQPEKACHIVGCERPVPHEHVISGPAQPEGREGSK